LEKQHRCIACNTLFEVPADKKTVHCPKCNLLHEIVEIDGKVFVKPFLWTLKEEK